MTQTENPTVVTAEARWETTSAARYMAQLCKHFGHKIPVTLNEADGQIVFSFGTCDLVAEPDALRMRITSEDETSLHQAQTVVISHLQRFAFRDLTEEAAAAITWARV